MPRRASATDTLAESLLRIAERGSIRACVAAAPARVTFATFRALGDAVQRLVRVDARRALRVARVMAKLQSRVGDGRAAALASRAQAESLLFLGRYAEALDTYRETVRLYAETGDDLESARVSVGEIPTLMYLSRFDEAMALGRRTEIVLRRHRERTYLGRLYMNLGNLCFTMDRYAEAKRYYARARRELTAVGGRDAVVVGLEINEGVVATNLDAMEQAERLLRAAVARAGEMGWRSLAAQGEFDLATVYALQSRYQDALAAIARAGRVFDAEDKSLAAIAEQTRAEIYLRLNMTDDAERAARAALTHFERAGMRYDAALARTLLGVALKRAGAHAEAREALESARTFLHAEGNHVRVAALDVHLARLDAADGDFDAARARAADAEAALRARGLSTRAAHARILRGELALDAGDTREARALLRGAARLPDRVADFERTVLRGRVHEADGDAARALASYTRATGLAETIRASLAGEEHKHALGAYAPPDWPKRSAPRSLAKNTSTRSAPTARRPPSAPSRWCSTAADRRARLHGPSRGSRARGRARSAICSTTPRSRPRAARARSPPRRASSRGSPRGSNARNWRAHRPPNSCARCARGWPRRSARSAHCIAVPARKRRRDARAVARRCGRSPRCSARCTRAKS